MSLVRQMIIVVILALGVGGAWWFWSSGGQESSGSAPLAQIPAVPVEVVEARLDTVDEVIEAVGTTRARQSVDVVALVSGRISDILFEAGQRVEKGQELVRLDSRIEEANLAEARALMEDARTQLERARQLLANRTVPQARVDELQAAYNAAQARLTAAERRLEERVIVAPFSGVVGLREVDEGSRITENTVLTRLDDLSLVELEFQVPEIFFGRLQRGQRVEAISAGMRDHRFVGTIVAIDTRIDAVSRAFRVRAEFPNPDNALPAGLFMAAQITLDSRAGAVVIPEQAVVAEGRSTYVYRVREGVAERVDVQLGLRRVGEVEVVAGLTAGDMVVTAGLQRLRSGMPVNIVSEHRPQITGEVGEQERAG
ncbi:efflux RND transporter periplasmic adaptor subunit [Telmatospirillum sp. J64-1]|uniref:efflux RND transporter periplasmic adaptor subunit n=1 Tax=Telmatospirillum sp. J64-1 TaxID=2502183 RepID=UPI00115C4509|nr:efflux RND transporter periplasmic adaptor subunit [Telmatospirillum sp. J64-1]